MFISPHCSLISWVTLLYLQNRGKYDKNQGLQVFTKWAQCCTSIHGDFSHIGLFLPAPKCNNPLLNHICSVAQMVREKNTFFCSVTQKSKAQLLFSTCLTKKIKTSWILISKEKWVKVKGSTTGPADSRDSSGERKITSRCLLFSTAQGLSEEPWQAGHTEPWQSSSHHQI